MLMEAKMEMVLLMIEKNMLKRVMKFWSNKICAFIMCLMCFTYCNATCRDEIQGLWSFEYDIRPPHTSRDEYYIFQGDKFLCINANELESCGYCRHNRRIGCHLFGFSSDFSNCDSLMNCGKYFALVLEGSSTCDVWEEIRIDEIGNSLEFIYNLCHRIADLPLHAKRVLYNESVLDHHNYAREFLNYDICRVKTNSVLLNEKHHNTNVKVPRDEVVTVKNLDGEFLKVEYIDAQGNSHLGYMKRNTLDFFK